MFNFMTARWCRRLLWVPFAVVAFFLVVFRHDALEVVITRVWPLSASTLRTSASWEAIDSLSLTKYAKTFEKRRKHYLDACAKTPVGTYFRPSRFNKVQLLRAENLAYCNIAKTGSTLWKQIIYYVKTSQSTPILQNGSFFDTNFKNIHGRMEGQRRSPSNMKEVKTVVFVREPYSRLFSAYVDKLFRPRVDNWRSYGSPILRYNLGLDEEHDASKQRLSCASHVTFAQYIRAFIHAETGVAPPGLRNPHYIPVSHHCGFCTGRSELDRLSHAGLQQLRRSSPASGANQGQEGPLNAQAESWRSGFVFDFIAKTEDITRDTQAIFSLLNLTHLLPPDFFTDVDTRRNTVKKLSERVFREALPTAEMKRCMTKEEALRRVWKDFQIRGLISRHELFPLSPPAADNATASQFVTLVLSAFDRSREDPDVKSNRKMAMAEAYSTIKLEDRNILRKIFEKDFHLFDYPDTIPEVFPDNDVFPSARYKFFDIFDRKLS